VAFVLIPLGGLISVYGSSIRQLLLCIHSTVRYVISCFINRLVRPIVTIKFRQTSVFKRPFRQKPLSSESTNFILTNTSSRSWL
jgi:hypothetical protein